MSDVIDFPGPAEVPQHLRRQLMAWPDSAVEALADAWASIDGHRDEFRAGRGLDEMEQPGGRYGGYMADAASMCSRLLERGYTLEALPKIPPDAG